MDGTHPQEVAKGIEALTSAGRWDVLGTLLLTCSEYSARALVSACTQGGVYWPLMLAACARRQLRRMTTQQQMAMGRRVFRDLDALEDVGGIPDTVRAEAEDIAAAADRTRDIAARREAERDTDPIRELCINELGTALARSPEALEGLLIVARGAAFEESRRRAAMKLANHQRSIDALGAALRTEELILIADASRLSPVAAKCAEAMNQHLDELVAKGDTAALQFVKEKHAEARIRALAAAKLSPG